MQMRIRSATTRLIAEASRMLHETASMLSEPGRGTAMRAGGTASNTIASRRTREASSRLDFVIVPSVFLDETKSVMISGSQG